MDSWSKPRYLQLASVIFLCLEFAFLFSQFLTVTRYTFSSPLDRCLVSAWISAISDNIPRLWHLGIPSNMKMNHT